MKKLLLIASTLILIGCEAHESPTHSLVASVDNGDKPAIRIRITVRDTGNVCGGDFTISMGREEKVYPLKGVRCKDRVLKAHTTIIDGSSPNGRQKLSLEIRFHDPLDSDQVDADLIDDKGGLLKLKFVNQ